MRLDNEFTGSDGELIRATASYSPHHTMDQPDRYVFLTVGRNRSGWRKTQKATDRELSTAPSCVEATVLNIIPPGLLLPLTGHFEFEEKQKELIKGHKTC